MAKVTEVGKGRGKYVTETVESLTEKTIWFYANINIPELTFGGRYLDFFFPK